MTPTPKQTQIINILKALNVCDEDIATIMVIIDDIAGDEYEKGYIECEKDNGL